MTTQDEALNQSVDIVPDRQGWVTIIGFVLIIALFIHLPSIVMYFAPPTCEIVTLEEIAEQMAETRR